MFCKKTKLSFKIDLNLFCFIGKESGQRKQICQFLQSIQIFLVRSRYNPVTISVFPAITCTVGYFLLQVFQGFPYYQIQRKGGLLGHFIIDVPKFPP
ncbi:hypothetical protein CXT99_06035 [Akkermansia muciniphila]|nr:hypothetical protein [Akkermansia sp.]PNC63716.1 hypothetical protein CXU07_02915 [Akkermansia muciniphila]MBE5700303.1 hypothetical protein [Akkermansia sp.]PNC66118.1 hypothetical protein CXU00_05060 [Akkermansia muciniphila]PNC66991.1 hypothetical protein CXT99_06035 [Akkermansia muciniphila]